MESLSDSQKYLQYILKIQKDYCRLMDAIEEIKCERIREEFKNNGRDVDVQTPRSTPYQTYNNLFNFDSNLNSPTFRPGSRCFQENLLEERLLNNKNDLFAAAVNNLSNKATNLVSRKKKNLADRGMRCGFCKKNGESDNVVYSHRLHDPRTKKVECPILRNYVCPLCNAHGDKAHTITYCPRYVPRILYLSD